MHDLTIHPRENDLVLATYGRALWTGDITPLQELTADVLDQPMHLFDVEPRARYGFSTQGTNYQLFGDKYLEVPNEPDALVVNYYLKADAAPAPRITITDAAGAHRSTDRRDRPRGTQSRRRQPVGRRRQRPRRGTGGGHPADAWRLHGDADRRRSDGRPSRRAFARGFADA